ncbi:MAG: glycosyltransferase [Deltaproteobacteria bacterium]|nr:MAG: glycosyltransferase [Deltaproteobacteria bacterium]
MRRCCSGRSTRTRSAGAWSPPVSWRRRARRSARSITGRPSSTDSPAVRRSDRREPPRSAPARRLPRASPRTALVSLSFRDASHCGGRCPPARERALGTDRPYGHRLRSVRHRPGLLPRQFRCAPAQPGPRTGSPLGGVGHAPALLPDRALVPLSGGAARHARRRAGDDGDHPRLQRGSDGAGSHRIGCGGRVSARPPRDPRRRRREHRRHLGAHRARRKRAALEAGFRRASGDVVVTIDSDSVIDRGALLSLAGVFRDPRVGAVAGKVSVYNRRSGLLPRMLHVHFVLSFDLLRAVQSVYGTVYCCPGALAAYRRAAVIEVLDEWKAQKFLGAPCTYGEDRALTNYLLDRGWDTLYQRSAVVHTIVPTTYWKLAKMYLRWDRSYIREELRFFRIVWKRPPLARAASLFETVLTNLRFPIGYVSSYLWLGLVWNDPILLTRLIALGGMGTAFVLLFYLHSERSMDLVYGVLYACFSAVALFWILPYAAFTARSRSWLTR